jgi:tRNA A37 threonylcarbamoyladenosine modification protein TsaB
MPDAVWEDRDDAQGPLRVDPALPLRDRLRYTLFDARGDRLYAACYKLVEWRLETVVEPCATTLGEILAGPVPEGAVFMGDGAARHQWDIQDAGYDVISLPDGIPTADGLVRLLEVGEGSAEPSASPVEDPSRWEPIYLRPSNAERTSGKGHLV